jgi:hypothetical protein
MSYPYPEADITRAKLQGISIGFVRFLYTWARGMVGKFLLYKVVLRYCDHAFVISDKLKEELEQRGIASSVMTPLPMGIDLDMIESVSAEVADERLKGKKVIAYLGALDKIRKIDFFFDVLTKVAVYEPDAVLLLIGDAHERSDLLWLKKKAEDFGVSERIIWTGWLPRAQAWSYAKGAHVGVCAVPPGFIFETMSPTKAVEFLALGVPVVVSHQPDQTKLVQDSGGGLSVDYDADDFAEAILKILKDESAAKKMGTTGKAYVQRCRSYEALASLVADVIKAKMGPTSASVGNEPYRAQPIIQTQRSCFPMKDSGHFTGPLFIIGMPRSGTKLLRGLLNRHPLIGIPAVETNFLPLWHRNWHTYGDLADWQSFAEFYKRQLSLPYFIDSKDHHGPISSETWYHLVKTFSLQGVFEALLRHDGNALDDAAIWGDKSPSYIVHLPLIHQLFPNARVIHIVRDVRDYCLSVHNAWGKNMVRAAQRWSDCLAKVSSESGLFPDAFLTIRYEDLLLETEPILSRTCSFLGTEFHHDMLSLARNYEPVGNAKGQTTVDSTNTKNYLRAMDSKLRSRIESITGPVMEMYGYNAENTGRHSRLGRAEAIYYQLLDGASVTRYEMRKKGLLGGFIYHLRQFGATR